jgi:hypothetical protein
MNSRGSTERSEGYPWSPYLHDYHGVVGPSHSTTPGTHPPIPPTRALAALGLPLRGRNPHTTPWVVLAPLGRPKATHGEPSEFKA